MPKTVQLQRNDAVCRLEEAALEAAQEIVEVNKRRKLRHEEVGEQLQATETEWRDLLAKNREIQAACAQADAEARELQQKLDRCARLLAFIGQTNSMPFVLFAEQLHATFVVVTAFLSRNEGNLCRLQRSIDQHW